MNIYVGNLSYQADEQSLGDLFAQYGEVRSVRVITDRETGRPRGFCFVEMETDAEEEAAIDALDGMEWMGRTLRVNKAKPREERGTRSGNYSSGGGKFSRQRY